MRIAIDARTACTKNAGTSIFIENTIEALAAVDSGNAYTLYVSNDDAEQRYRGRWPNFTVERIGVGFGIVDKLLGFNLKLRAKPADVFFAQFYVPKYCPCPSVAMIADLSIEHVPDTIEAVVLDKMRASIRRSAKQATRLIAPSEFTKADIATTYGIDAEKISVIYHGASTKFGRVEDQQELNAVRERYDLPERFLLSVGTIQPRKNLPRLIEAYAMLTQANAEVPPLVLVGSNGWLTDDSLNSAKKFGVEDRVRFSGYVDDAHLPAIYSMAEVFVYPSYFEGFGLPPLEAMQCGTAVITGDRTSLPEVVGDAGVTVDPFDAAALAAAMSELLGNDQLRADLGRRGVEQAKKFSWTEAARETIEVFELAAAER